MSLAALRLHHSRRSGDADPELAAMDGSAPPSRHASIGIGEDRHVHTHAARRRGIAPASLE